LKKANFDPILRKILIYLQGQHHSRKEKEPCVKPLHKTKKTRDSGIIHAFKKGSYSLYSDNEQASRQPLQGGGPGEVIFLSAAARPLSLPLSCFMVAHPEKLPGNHQTGSYLNN